MSIASQQNSGRSREYMSPQRAIFNEKDLNNFKKSEAYSEIATFVKLCAEKVVGLKISDTSFPTSDAVSKIIQFLSHVETMVNDIPPILQPMRFGNKAFRIWHSRLIEEAKIFLVTLIPEDLKNEGAVKELSPYLCSSFGNEVRIDYGTGHELSFVVFLLCLFKIRVLCENDFRAIVLRLFVAYIKCMRRLQLVYLLEPAGSHGVWGLDDYHCIPFLWGAAQLCGGDTDITPADAVSDEVIRSQSNDYLYLEGIGFVKKIKKGAPFTETSPMLYDISKLSDWTRVLAGLVRLFEGEVLSKKPVIQHLVFGTILKCTWTPSPPLSVSNAAPGIAPIGAVVFK